MPAGSGPRERLGPFTLIEPMARGGMGVVYRGHHLDGTPVAVKIITGKAALSPEFREMFRNEVRAMASLSHPGIIAVLDYGELPKAFDGLYKGSPYFAMEYCGGGDLRAATWRWTTLYPVLLQLLDALGHAHARGVVHRDLKPGNVLLGAENDLRAGVRLTDFGVAWSSSTEGHYTAGTRKYMAPEQHEGRWRDYGPATDLYALACLVWRLLVGHAPYRGRGPQLSYQHVTAPLPDFEPKERAPPLAEMWLHRLLRKDPADRYVCAADARSALELVGPGIPQVGEENTTQVSMHRPVLITVDTGEGGFTPLPLDWRDATSKVMPPQLWGAGLTLFALREVPLAGHEVHRDALWRALVQAQSQDEPQFVLIMGMAGTGKTHLARWFVERAHEAIGCEHFKLAPGHGVGAMLQGRFKTAGLPPEEREARLRDQLARLTDREWVLPVVDGVLREEEDESLDATTEAGQRYSAVRRIIEGVARDRPAILFVDDLHACEEAFPTIKELLAKTGPRKVVVVATVQMEALAERPALEPRIGDLLRMVDSMPCKLEPLPEVSRQELLQQLLHLTPGLAAEVDSRTGGNPAFAVQVVGDLIERDTLELSGEGFRLRRGQALALPDDLHQVWNNRIDRVLSVLPNSAGVYLEVAAALGMEVHAAEWEGACDQLERGSTRGSDGLAMRRRIVERLLAARLAELTPTGMRFAHGMVRATLARRATEANRWAGHHWAIVKMLKERGKIDPWRLGEHTLSAGDPARAIKPLLEGLERRTATHGLTAGLEALQRCDVAMVEAAVPRDDPRWIRLWCMSSRLRRARTGPAEAITYAKKALKLATSLGRLEDQARATLELARCHEAQGDLHGALRELKGGAASLLRERLRGEVLAQYLNQMALLGLWTHQLDDAERWSTQAAAVIARGELGGLANARNLMLQMQVATAQGRLEEALVRSSAAERAYRELHSWELASVLSSRGDVLKQLNRWGDAEEVLREAIKVYETGGVRNSMAHLRLALCRIAAGAPDEALELVEPILGAPAALPSSLAQVVATAATAMKGNWSAFSDAFTPAVERVNELGVHHADLAWLFTKVADRAFEVGETGQARAAAAAAIDQWQALKKPREVKRLMARFRG